MSLESRIDLNLGTAFPFILADATGEPGLVTPAHDVSTVLHLGAGPVPEKGESFAQEGLLWKARDVLAGDDPLNPFDVPCVMAVLA